MLRITHRLLVAAAVAAMLATTAVPVLAASEPVLRGVVLDANGQPFAVDEARMTLIAPDEGGIIAAEFDVASDGSFAVELLPWGSPADPAEVRVSITGVVTTVVLDDDGCSQQFAPVAERTFPVALEAGGDPDPIEIVAQEQLIGSVCGGQATPAPTLPPTDVEARPGGQPTGTSSPAALAVLLGVLAFVATIARAGDRTRATSRAG